MSVVCGRDRLVLNIYSSQADAFDAEEISLLSDLAADFAYRLWTYPLETIRVGYTGLLGQTKCQQSDPKCDPMVMTAEAGFKVGGGVELWLVAVAGIQLFGRADFDGASARALDGFAVSVEIALEGQHADSFHVTSRGFGEARFQEAWRRPGRAWLRPILRWPRAASRDRCSTSQL